MGSLAVGLIILILLMFIGVPVAMAFGALSLFLIYSFDLSTGLLIPTAFYQIKSVVLLTIPFFILVGSLMGNGGLAVRIIEFINSIVGRYRGGLGAATVVACAMFGSIGGTCSSAVAAIGTIMIPRMEENGYKRGYATALVACSSILGQLIPPSVPMILYALITYQSIPGCWMATVSPAVLTIIILWFLNYFMTKNMPIKTLQKVDLKSQLKLSFKATKKATLALLLPFIILGGIYGGVATPTETACVSALYIIPVSMFVYKSLTLKSLWKAYVSASTTTGVLIIMLFFVMINTRIMNMEQIPQEIANFIMNASSNKYLTLFFINIFLLIIGMIMDDVSGTILSASLLYPVMKELGVHPLHFAAILGVNLGFGNVTPPTAPILFLAGRIGKCKIENYLSPSLILMGCGMLPVLLATTYFPDLSLFLPRLLGFID